MADVKVLS